MNTEQELLQQALSAFKKRTGIHLTKAKQSKQEDIDAVLTLKHDSVEQFYFVKVKRYLTRQTLGATLKELKEFKRKPLLVADYVNPEIAEELRAMGINFIDTLGNAFVKELPLYIYVTGNKPKQLPVNKIGKAYNPAGLKVLFVLLCKPELINAPFREIARSAGVANGTVGKVIEDLKIRKHLKVVNGNRVLLGMKELLTQWTLLYPIILRPKLLFGRYEAQDAEWWEQAEFGKSDFLGGEPAADKITRYLKHETVAVYTYNKPAQFVVKNHLREAVEGKTEILKAFWDTGLNDNNQNTVPALLIYTDLLATGDSRNIETAEKIYEQELAKHFR